MPHWRSKALRGSWRIATVALMLLSCVSCTRIETSPPPDVHAQQLVGHQIRVTTVDGRILEFKVEMVTDNALVGVRTHFTRDRRVRVPEQVRFDEIAALERRDFSFWRTACVVAACAAGLLVWLMTRPGAWMEWS